MLSTKPQPQIRLENPVHEQFESFIISNGATWDRWAQQELRQCAPDVFLDLQERGRTMPSADFNYLFRQEVAKHNQHSFLVEQDSAKGQHVIICGAGPSLKDHATDWCKKGDQVWGCNSAAIWLHEHQRKITHAFTVDQTPAMVNEWRAAPDVEYMVATTVHPHLIEHLEAKNRRIRFFHNYVGVKKQPVELRCSCGAEPDCARCKGVGRYRMPYEDWLYALLFGPTIRAGSGLNAVTRAIDVALFAGAEKITVIGADHALRYKRRPPKGAIAGSPEHVEWLKKYVTMHANGSNPLAHGATAMTMEGWICPNCECTDGTCDHCMETCKCKERHLWISKPDMLISAVFLVMMSRKIPHMQIIGDVLPNALMKKPDAFLDRLPMLVDEKGQPVRIW